MEFWLERSLDTQGWVQILFLLYLGIILVLKLIDPVQFNSFVRIFKFKEYKRRYSININFKVFKLFYILIFFLISVSLSFLIILYENKSFDKAISLNRYLKILVFLKTFIVLRFLIINSIIKNLKLFPMIKPYYFKILIFYGYIFILTMGVLSVFYLQNNLSLVTINLLIGCLALIFTSYHIFVFKEFIKFYSKNFLYLFYYLCAFKIAPWLWFLKILQRD